MRRCELCKAKARTHCASDRASLCWDCDASVHSVSFLVARHSRRLLCDVCQSPMPWTVSGGKITPTVSVCEQCAGQELCEGSGGGESEEDNQIVPYSPLPPESDDEAIDGGNVVVWRKKMRIEADRSCAMSRRGVNVCGSGILDSLRMLHREDTGSGQQTVDYSDYSGPSI
ncbi:B-box domain protein 31-like isoform X1 [Salvia hispanica]|uniref:B-box domain protein 31-like isoform X1 n=1 Tax=Salvia hispanica TaxID=49212 RepID=UPI002009A966|nr:B-box domain protein 31-like isoform X1 [Salvia hispanica]